MASSFLLDPSTDLPNSIPRIIRHVPKRQYKDKQYEGGEVEWNKKLDTSSTVYVGNMSFYTNEYQIHQLFSMCGSIKRIIMGLDKNKKTPCGFCFVEFDERDGATKAINYLNNTLIDGREIKIGIDAGFKEGRQFGRGSHGGQLGDERRKQYEERQAANNQRGGYGGGGANILTRSITIVACLSIISIIMVTCMTSAVEAVDKPVKPVTLYTSTSNRHSSSPQFLNPVAIRRAQIAESRTEFEKAFASFLVNIMKAAKPSLLKAFISATLADKQLKDIAIAMFFNNTETTDE